MRSKILYLFLILNLILILSSSVIGGTFAQSSFAQSFFNDSLSLDLEDEKELPSSVYRNTTTRSAQGTSIFNYLNTAGGEVLEMTLTTDLQNLIINKNLDEYQVANLKVRDKNGEFFDYNLKIKARGKYRRRVCDFPPLKLNFSKSGLEKDGFIGDFDKLKLVTHCVSKKMESKENVLKEFLTYQLYNELTDNSFAVKLVKIKYVDFHNSQRPFTRYGFLIENTDEMSDRLNGEVCDCHGVPAEKIARPQSNLMAMFQFMIGNEDWTVTGLRNVKAVNLHGGQENILVPYDFDFSGMVNARYALPDPNLHHKTVQQRHFFGQFKNDQEFNQMRDYFLLKREDLERTIKSFKLLSPHARHECQLYLEEFYSILETMERVELAKGY